MRKLQTLSFQARGLILFALSSLVWGSLHAQDTDTNAVTSTIATPEPGGDIDQEEAPRGHYHSFYVLRILILGGGSAIALGLATLIRAHLKAKDEAEKNDFLKFSKDFTHARLLPDPHGLGSGRFRLDYPKLQVGEFQHDVKGCVTEGQDTVHLRNGKVIQLYKP